MTRERAKELAPIIAAYGEGKRIQARQPNDLDWYDYGEWDFSSPTVQYRIAPEPRKRAMTRDELLNFLAERPNALVQLNNDSWNNPGRYDYSFPTPCYSYCLVTNGVRSEPRKFEIEEEA